MSNDKEQQQTPGKTEVERRHAAGERASGSDWGSAGLIPGGSSSRLAANCYFPSSPPSTFTIQTHSCTMSINQALGCDVKKKKSISLSDQPSESPRGAGSWSQDPG